MSRPLARGRGHARTTMGWAAMGWALRIGARGVAGVAALVRQAGLVGLVGLIGPFGAGVPAAVQAVQVAGPGGTAEQGRRFIAPVPAERADAGAAPSLAPAVLQAVDAAALQVRLAGRTVALHPSQLRVLGPSGQNLGGASALRPGMAVRFSLEPGDERQRDRRIVLIYVDRGP